MEVQVILEWILYVSAGIAAIAFLILVIFLSKALQSLQVTLDSISKTLNGLERQMEGVTRETTLLLHKTNALAEDIQKKSESLGSVVDSVKDVGVTVQKFNSSLQTITNSVNFAVEQNKDKVSQVIQWGNVLLEMKDRWTHRKKDKAVEGKGESEKGRERSYY